MSIVRHGISIGIERVESEFFMTIAAIGKLTHEDYELITPMIDSALEGIKHPEIKVFVDLTRLEGWELRAAWDDFKIGLKHGNKFTRIAVLGNQAWLEWASKVGSWFMSGDVKHFEDEEAALEWLQA